MKKQKQDFELYQQIEPVKINVNLQFIRSNSMQEEPFLILNERWQSLEEVKELLVKLEKFSK